MKILSSTMAAREDLDEMNLKIFFKAAAEGDLEKLRNILNNSEIDVNFIDDHHECTAIGAAAKNGHLEVVKELLKYRPELNQLFIDNDFEREIAKLLLDLACKGKQLEIIQLLLEHGAMGHSKNYTTEVKEMIKVSILAYKIYGLGYLEAEDNSCFTLIEQNTKLKALFIQTFKNYLLSPSNLPGNDEKLEGYGENIKRHYDGKLSNSLLREIIKVTEEAQTFYFEEIKSSVFIIMNHIKDLKIPTPENITQTELEHCLKNIFSNLEACKVLHDSLEINETIWNVINKNLAENKSLSFDIKYEILEFITSAFPDSYCEKTIIGNDL